MKEIFVSFFVRSFVAVVAAATGALCAFACVSPVAAQTGPYLNSAPAVIDASTPCTAPITRTIVVPDSFVIADLDVGLIATHTWRTDIRLELTSPGGTTVQLLAGPGDQNFDNYNIRLDDEAVSLVNSGSHASSDDVSATPYQSSVRPDVALAAFDEEQAQGTWALTLCDAFTSFDDGEFRRAELLFTAATTADIALTKSVDNQLPTVGETVTFTVSVSNLGPIAATGVVVADRLPSGFAYLGDDSGGAYDPVTGIWVVHGPIEAGESISLQISAIVNGSGSHANVAEVIASDQSDIDSIPNNAGAAPFEDDTDSIAVFPGRSPGSPPALSCGSSAVRLDWDVNDWPAGSLAQSYAANGETFSFSFSGATNRFLPNFSGISLPATNNALTGGLAPAQDSLLVGVNFAFDFEKITLEFSVGTPGIGIPELQFTVFDVDINTGAEAFVDFLQVGGSIDGVPVAGTLTNGVANTVAGSSATGIAISGNSSGDGNVVVTFKDAVDRIVIEYGSGPGASS